MTRVEPMHSELFRRTLGVLVVAASAAFAQPGAPTTRAAPTEDQIKAIEAEVASMDIMRRFGIAEAPAKSAGDVRIATYNVANLFDDIDDAELSGEHDDADETKPLHERVAAARAIRRIDADVLCLEEVESEQALLWFRDQFLSGMGYDHVAAIDAGDERGIEQAVLSRLPISNAQNWPALPLGGVHPDKYGSNENFLAGQALVFHRSPLRVDLELPGPAGRAQTLTLFVVHHKSGRYSAYWREAEARGTVARIEELTKAHPDRPVIVLGDFNAETRDASVQTFLNAGFHDIFANRGGGADVVTHESGRRIDLILANPAARTQLLSDKAFVLGTAARPVGVDWRDLPTFPGMASDHYPVVVDLRPGGPGEAGSIGD